MTNINDQNDDLLKLLETEEFRHLKQYDEEVRLGSLKYSTCEFASSLLVPAVYPPVCTNEEFFSNNPGLTKYEKGGETMYELAGVKVSKKIPVTLIEPPKHCKDCVFYKRQEAQD